jgi:hypothetical protein
VDEDENINAETKPQTPNTTDNNTITKIANRHLTIKFNKKLENKSKAQRIIDQEAVKLTFGDPVTSQYCTTENNFTFEDQKDYHPSPERKLVVKQIPPPNNGDEQESDKENHNFSPCQMNMFECYDDSSSSEEEPRDLSESLINLDTYTGKVELYDDQIPDEEALVYSHKDFIIIKPQFDTKRMIALPKNNEPVNISEMLSRSFIFDNNESMTEDKWMNLNLSANYETIDRANFKSMFQSKPNLNDLYNTQSKLNGSPTKLNESCSKPNFFDQQQIDELNCELD